MKKLLFTIVMGLLISSLNAQKLEPTSHIWVAGTADNFKGGYTFSYATAGTAWNGSLISFGGFDNNYDTQINSNYYRNLISFRTKNGDSNTWNPWVELATKGANDFIGNQIIKGKLGIVDNSGSQFIASYTGGKMFGDYTYTAISYGETTLSGSSANIGYISHRSDKSLSGLYFVNYGESEETSSLFIRSGGNVGIGITTPKNKLDVNGTIHSKEVKVDMEGWPDFVFTKEYNLPTLEQVEKHIAEKGHLQNIPSEEEVLQNGINLGDMNAKLLQKIEELTLYAIEQEKNNNKQSLRIEVLEKENEVLKNVLERLSNVEEKLK
jgi:hypothetical protein